VALSIEIGTELLPPDPQWKWDPKNPLTGTTKFYVRVAEAFARIGHHVRVLSNVVDPQDHNGVEYRGNDAELVGADLVLDCNLQRTDDTGGTRFQWTSFYNRPDTCVGEGYDRLFLVSSFIHSTLEPALKLPHDKVTVLELGCEIPTIAEPGLASRPKVCCYTSSPDRGGHFLASIWPEVKAATGYELRISPYNTALPFDALCDLYKQSRFWLYPATGLSSIISCLEAQASGCIPFYVPHMDLPETCRYGVTTSLVTFKDDLIRTLHGFNDDRALLTMEDLRTLFINDKPIPTWDDVARKILSHV
jgi:hypothetical protein